MGSHHISVHQDATRARPHVIGHVFHAIRRPSTDVLARPDGEVLGRRHRVLRSDLQWSLGLGAMCGGDHECGIHGECGKRSDHYNMENQRYPTVPGECSIACLHHAIAYSHFISLILQRRSQLLFDRHCAVTSMWSRQCPSANGRPAALLSWLLPREPLPTAF